MQIWLLLSSLESFFQGKHERLGAILVLSGAGLFCCGLTAWTTTLDLMKGFKEGRSKTYHRETEFKK